MAFAWATNYGNVSNRYCQRLNHIRLAATDRAYPIVPRWTRCCWSPLGGEKIGPDPCGRAKGGVKRSTLTEAAGIPLAV
jgi:hypothetical protein